MASARRSAFTLVELLVVIAIIAVLIGLLVPAVQQVREAANKTTCQNNLHQIGVALHNYLGTYKFFPPAYKSSTNGNTPLPGWGWGALLLPFVDQKGLYDQLNPVNTNFGGGTNPAPGTALTQTMVPVYRCPSDVAPDVNPDRFNHGMSNYRAVAGAGSAYTLAGYLNWSENKDWGGVMFQNSRISTAMIPDGTSTTLAVGECSYNKTASTPRTGAVWAGMSGWSLSTPPTGARVSDVMWWVDPATAQINGTAAQAFSSRHPGGAHFCFCDGSVRFFQQGGNVTTLRFLASRADGTPVNLPD